jgi:hypothetical protein
MILMVVLVMAGVFSKPLSVCILAALRLLCAGTGFPTDLLMSLV